jgi:hypothetical protein
MLLRLLKRFQTHVAPPPSPPPPREILSVYCQFEIQFLLIGRYVHGSSKHTQKTSSLNGENFAVIEQFEQLFN